MFARIGVIVVFSLALHTSLATAQEQPTPVIPDKPARAVGEPDVVVQERPAAAVQARPEAMTDDAADLKKVDAACRIILNSPKAD